MDKEKSRLNLKKLKSTDNASVSSSGTSGRPRNLGDGYEIKSQSSSDLGFPVVVDFDRDSDDERDSVDDDMTADYFGTPSGRATSDYSSRYSSSRSSQSDDLTLSTGYHSVNGESVSSYTNTLSIREEETEEVRDEREGNDDEDDEEPIFVHDDISFEGPSALMESSQEQAPSSHDAEGSSLDSAPINLPDETSSERRRREAADRLLEEDFRRPIVYRASSSQSVESTSQSLSFMSALRNDSPSKREKVVTVKTQKFGL
ncbi:unnamed protein product [Symbiodinium microadriaticum]|nr:unnamed protein product [Symbiodinium microadriaticum]